MPNTEGSFNHPKTESLKVMEIIAPQDVSKSIARIHKDVMDRHGIASMDIIRLKGKRATYAKCLPLILEGLPKDQAKSIIRIDLLTRNNLGVAVGDTILVNKAESKQANKVVVKALEALPPLDGRYLADVLNGFPLTTGDKFIVPYFGGRLTFEVLKIAKTSPSKKDEILGKDIAGIISGLTTFVIKQIEDLSIRLTFIDILKKEDTTGNVTVGFTLSLSYGDMIEVGEFQRVIVVKKEQAEAQREKFTQSYLKYNEIIQEVKRKSNDKIANLTVEDNDKLDDLVRRILKEAKIEILTKCAEVE